MKYIFASSDDSLDFYPNNKSTDFTVELPRVIRASECALGEISFLSQSQDLVVLCDLCEESYYRDSLVPILRIVKAPGELENLYFVPITRHEIKRFHIRILTKQLEEPSDDLGVVICTLVIN